MLIMNTSSNSELSDLVLDIQGCLLKKCTRTVRECCRWGHTVTWHLSSQQPPSLNLTVCHLKPCKVKKQKQNQHQTNKKPQLLLLQAWNSQISKRSEHGWLGWLWKHWPVRHRTRGEHCLSLLCKWKRCSMYSWEKASACTFSRKEEPKHCLRHSETRRAVISE